MNSKFDWNVDQRMRLRDQLANLGYDQMDLLVHDHFPPGIQSLAMIVATRGVTDEVVAHHLVQKAIAENVQLELLQGLRRRSPRNPAVRELVIELGLHIPPEPDQVAPTIERDSLQVPRAPAWKSIDQGWVWPVAGRTREIDKLRVLLSGQIPQRIVTLAGPEDQGKSFLVRNLSCYADHIGLRHSVIKLTRETLLEVIHRTWIADLPDVFCSASAAAHGDRSAVTVPTEVIADLGRVDLPTLLIIDEYEAASDEIRHWFEQTLLPRVLKNDLVIIVFAGNRVPPVPMENSGARWLALTMGALTTTEWLTFGQRHLAAPWLTLNQVETHYLRASGVPAAVVERLRRFVEDHDLLRQTPTLAPPPPTNPRRERALERLVRAGSDPNLCAAATVDLILADRPEDFAQAFAAAAISVEFDCDWLGRILACDNASAQQHEQELQGLAIVESLGVGGRWRVKDRYRRAWQALMQAEQPEELRQLARQAAAISVGTDAIQKIRRIHYELLANETEAPLKLADLYEDWRNQGRIELNQILAGALEELVEVPFLSPAARSRVLYCLVATRGTTVDESQAGSGRWTLKRKLELAKAALQSAEASGDLWAQVDAQDLIGDLNHAGGDLNEALQCYLAERKALERQPLAIRITSKWQRDLSVSHNKVGGVYEAQGNLPGALREFEADKQIMQRLTELDPANTGWQRDLSVSHNRVGDVYQAQGNLPGALREFEAGKKILQRLTELDPANTGWRGDLAVSYACIGFLHLSLEHRIEAREALIQARDLLRGLVQIAPDHARWRADLAGVGRQLANLG